LFVDENTSNVSTIALEDELNWNSQDFKVTGVIKNLGHYEFNAKRIR